MWRVIDANTFDTTDTVHKPGNDTLRTKLLRIQADMRIREVY